MQGGLAGARTLSAKRCLRGNASGLLAHARPTVATVAQARRTGHKSLEVSCKAQQGQQLNGKWCRITGKTANNGFSVSHSHVRTKRLQHVNLHVKRVYWPRGTRWVK